MNKILVALLVLGAVGAAGYALWRKKAGAQPAAEVAAARATSAPVERRDINFSVGVAGEIGPAEQVSVRPEVNGRINALPVDVGDRVAKGALLFSLVETDLRIEIEQRETEIKAAKLQLEQARRDYERDQRLFTESLISREEHETSKTTFELADNSIKRAEQVLALAAERLTKTRIVAPFDCTILTRPVSLGQAVSGSGGFNSGTEVLTIADLNSMVINAHVNQADVIRLKSGMEVDVTVDAIPGLTVRGVVERIAPQATVKNNIKGFATRIALKNVDPRIQPGMTANISIPVAAASGVLAVPLPAIFSELGERYVYVKGETGYQKRPVLIGVSDYFNAEITDGLEEGEIVAIEPPPGITTTAAPTNAFTQSGGARPPAGAPATPRPPAAAGARPATRPGGT